VGDVDTRPKALPTPMMVPDFGIPNARFLVDGVKSQKIDAVCH
jgi:hypothetical protein